MAVAMQLYVSTPSFNAEAGMDLFGGSCQHEVPHGAWVAPADLWQVLPLLGSATTEAGPAGSVARQGQSCG